MAHKIILPKLGTNIEKAKIISWFKKEGEAVSKGELLVEIETDKASFQLESEASGVLRKVFYRAGSEVPITRSIAIIAEPQEDISAAEKEVKAESAAAPALYAKDTWKDWFAGKSRPQNTHSAPVVRMSPRAKKLAQEHGLDMEALAGYFGTQKVIDAEEVEGFLSVSEKIVIYGAGLGAKQVIEVVSQLPEIKVVGLIDDNPELKGKTIYGYRVLGGFDYLKDAFAGKEFSSIALSFHSEVRRKIFLKLKDKLPQAAIKTLKDPRAVISQDVQLGEGVFVEAGAVIGPGVKLGDGVIVDLGSVVCHDCSVGAHSHLSPGCSLSGIVALKENVLVGVGASVNSTVTVGRNVIITPGSAVMNDVEDDVIVSGIPAAVIGESRRGK